MIRDHRPYFIKKAYLNFQKAYVKRYLRPQLEQLGDGFTFMKPWYVEIFGAPVRLGRNVHVIATRDRVVRLSVWSETADTGRISIGDCCLICPGVRISSAAGIAIGDNCMIASNAYITDSDWHDIYNRMAFGTAAAVTIENNVWIGDSVIVCKGVVVGENSILGAGAVVVSSIPANSIAAGNPAKVVKSLDPSRALTTRSSWFKDPVRLAHEIDRLDQEKLAGNSLRHWLRHVFLPREGD